MDIDKYKNAIKFSLKGQELKAYITSVYDGDTITASIFCFGDYYLFRVRVNGVDTPEMRGHSEDEKKRARAAKEFVKGLVLEKFVTLQCKDWDKYGRLLADVILPEGNLSELLVTQHFGLSYSGGTKTPFKV